MRKMFMTRTALPLLALAALTIAGTAGAATVGINAAIRNKVVVRAATDPAAHPAILKARVSLGDQVQTANASMLQILLLDRSNFTVGSNARVTIDRFVYDPQRSASAVGASVAKGAFRFISGRSIHNMPGKTAITTPVASIGVRGTIFEGVVGPDAVKIAAHEGAAAGGKIDPVTATLIVLRGPGATPTEPGGAIEVTAFGGTIPLDKPGMALFIPGPDQKPIGPFDLSDKGLLALHDLLRTTPDAHEGQGKFDAEGNPIIDRTLEVLPDLRNND
ncbi:MAG: FecR domain-containing protein [Sphingomicrobium sp.]